MSASERNYRGKLDGRAWDWTPFNACFGTSGIRVSDVDGFVERNCCFLFIEGKPDPDCWENCRGQRWAYERLAKQPNTYVLVLYGEPNEPVSYEWVGRGAVRPGDQPAAIEQVSRWFQWANRQDRFAA